MDYEKDTASCWWNRLWNEWGLINLKLIKHGISLRMPGIEIVGKQWGEYYHENGHSPIIRLSRDLFENFEWGSVLYVFKHEIAHYIVDMAWHMGDLQSHGEAFAKACNLMEIDSRRCSEAKDLHLEDERFSNRERMVSKIKKVMALSASSEKGEAETALKKAEELMLKWNIDSLESRKSSEYLFRPVGPVMKRVPNWARDLANFVKEFYFIEHILSHWGCNQGRYFEFFGTKENLDIAEYIFCCLMRQAEKLWEDYSSEIRSKFGGVRGYASKECFIEGVISGYRDKMREQKKYRESGYSCQSLIWKGDPLLKEMYHKSYPNMVMNTYYRNAAGGGRDEGYDKGKNLSLNSGLTPASSVGNRRVLLNA